MNASAAGGLQYQSSCENPSSNAGNGFLEVLVDESQEIFLQEHSYLRRSGDHGLGRIGARATS